MFPEDPNERWRRVVAQACPAQQLQDLLCTVQLPQQQLREAVQGIQPLQQDIRKILRAAPPQQQLSFAAQAARLPDEQWKELIRANQEQWGPTLERLDLGQQQWQEINQSMDLSQHFRELLASIRYPRAEWATTLEALRTAARDRAWDSVAEATDALQDEIEGTQPVVEPDESRTSWLLNLPMLSQVALLLAALKVLDEVGKFLATLANDDLPPEVRAATQAVFGVAALLLLVLQLRTKPPDEGD